MQWKYREKRYDQQHHEKVSFFCFWENVLFNSDVACYATCSCKKTFKQPSQMFSETDPLKNFAIFTGKNLYWSVFFWSFRTEGLHFYLKSDSNAGVFCEYCEMFKNSFFIEDLFFVPFQNFCLIIDNWYFRVIKLDHITERTSQ